MYLYLFICKQQIYEHRLFNKYLLVYTKNDIDFIVYESMTGTWDTRLFADNINNKINLYLLTSSYADSKT